MSLNALKGRWGAHLCDMLEYHPSTRLFILRGEINNVYLFSMVCLKIYVKYVTSHSYMEHAHEEDRTNFLQIWKAVQNVLLERISRIGFPKI
jgi:hypothetical protein